MREPMIFVRAEVEETDRQRMHEDDEPMASLDEDVLRVAQNHESRIGSSAVLYQ